jgi:hypothetical protein
MIVKNFFTTGEFVKEVFLKQLIILLKDLKTRKRSQLLHHIIDYQETAVCGE